MASGSILDLESEAKNPSKLLVVLEKFNGELPRGDAAPRSSEQYFFWTGKSTVRSSKGKWQRRLQRLFELASVTGGHAHRFRDTFAVELLLAGVPLDRVSVLLGHSSIRITERHYAPWTRSRQEQIEADLRAAWKVDPVVLSQSRGTAEMRRKFGRIN